MPIVANTDEIVRVIGYAAFERLRASRAGRDIFVPKRIEAASRLVQFIGEEAALKLVAEFGGFSIYVPNGKAVPSVREKILDWKTRYPSMTHGDIADAVGCAEFTVRRHLRSLRTEQRSGLPEQANG